MEGLAVEDVGLGGPGDEGGEEDAGCEGETEDVWFERYGLHRGHCRRWGAQLYEWGFSGYDCSGDLLARRYLFPCAVSVK